MQSVRILRIAFDRMPLYKDGHFEMTLAAMDRVSDPSQVFRLKKNIYIQRLVAMAGINASGKTMSMKLLHLAMALVLENMNLNDPSLYGKELLQDGTEMRIHFMMGDMFYELHSIVGKREQAKLGQQSFFFKDEILYQKKARLVQAKSDPFHLSETTTAILQRSRLPQEALSVLKDGDSIIIKVTRDNGTALQEFLPFTNINFLMAKGNMPAGWLRAFDPSIDMLSVSSASDGEYSYQIKFHNQEPPICVQNPIAFSNLVSSGTIKGLNLVYYVRAVLAAGGYLLLDEIENHMNKQLIRMITDIFKNENINRNGACLIFTTHYAEILDFMDRKDNIFITRRESYGVGPIEVLNFANEVKRNDVKKSDVILSNYIKGTAPLYESIQALEDTLCEGI